MNDEQQTAENDFVAIEGLQGLTKKNKDGVEIVRCWLCGSTGINGADVAHTRRCEYKSEQVRNVAVKPTTDSASAFAANVRKTALTLGRDAEVIEAVRTGRLSRDDAQNTDD